ncbi:MAG: hypothetical protein WD887_00640 [Candidatus Saccharimonadales bacterium]
MKKLFELHQKITFVGNEYRVLKDRAAGPKLAGYAKQKRLAIREKFTLFSDDAQTEIIAQSQARSIMDFGATYDVLDNQGKPLAVVKKQFKKSIISSTWTISKPISNKLLFTVYEKSLPIAIARRLWNFIPFIGEFLPFPLRFHFTVSDANGKIVGEYEKITIVRDHYALHLDEKAIPKLDKRAWMITTVLLDALQSR